MLKIESYKNLYLTASQKRMFLIMPKWYVGIFSRGTGKTFVKQALRSYLTAINVPKGLSVFYAATYVGAQQRTVADTIRGWKQLGLIEGTHFVKNIKPPEHFETSFYEPLTYKNVISFFNGHAFIIGSNDRPGMVNSLSITGGIFVDEARFIKEEIMKQDLYPAIRGQNVWGKHNPFVFSRTYTSDMPFISDDAEWLHDMAKLMNTEHITLIAQASIKVEELKNLIFKHHTNYYLTENIKDKEYYLYKINGLNKRLEHKQNQLNIIRCHFINDNNTLTNRSVYFDTGSFIANINILGEDYFNDNFDSSENLLIARTSFLNIKPSQVEKKFYSNIKSKHFILGDFNYNIIENFGIADNETQLKAIHINNYNPNQELDIEFDFGDMCSCSVSQTFGQTELYIVSLEVLLPFSVDDLVFLIIDYFSNHNKKVVNIYKDPSGNYMKNKQGDVFSELTINAFKKAGWYIIDKCPNGSINPSHTAKHQLVNMILQENDNRFPLVRIIKETNKQLVNSINIAPLILKIKPDGTKQLLKDKSSEKKTKLENKPMNTTDHSDHFDIKLWHKYNHLLPYSNIF